MRNLPEPESVSSSAYQRTNGAPRGGKRARDARFNSGAFPSSRARALARLSGVSVYRDTFARLHSRHRDPMPQEDEGARADNRSASCSTGERERPFSFNILARCSLTRERLSIPRDVLAATRRRATRCDTTRGDLGIREPRSLEKSEPSSSSLYRRSPRMPTPRGIRLSDGADLRSPSVPANGFPFLLFRVRSCGSKAFKHVRIRCTDIVWFKVTAPELLTGRRDSVANIRRVLTRDTREFATTVLRRTGRNRDTNTVPEWRPRCRFVYTYVYVSLQVTSE